jgi:hypothetical protein
VVSKYNYDVKYHPRTVGLSTVFGWIEKDGKEGLTSDAEKVFLGDAVERNVRVRINQCYSW